MGWSVINKAKEEIKNHHLIKKDGTVPFLIVLKCKHCGLKKPPAALLYRKLELEKRTLRCKGCGHRAFVRTDRTRQQGELYREAIGELRHVQKKYEEINDEIEGKMEDDVGIKQKGFLDVFGKKAGEM